MRIGDIVQNKISGSFGVIDRVNLGREMRDLVLVRFYQNGVPTGDGICVPWKQLRFAHDIARGNVERHLGDVAAEYESEEAAADAIYDEAYTLAFDALVDAGLDHKNARTVAQNVAQCYAQP